MRGIYQHCAKKHLPRYLAEFDFRYTHREATGFNDKDRSVQAIKGIVGKRLRGRTQPAPLKSETKRRIYSRWVTHPHRMRRAESCLDRDELMQLEFMWDGL